MLNVYNWYKFASLLYRIKIPILPKLITYLIRFVFSAYIPHTADIGDHVVFGYGGLGIVIHDRARIGNYCHIDQNVTIGGTSKKYEVPVIGDNVYIGAGAKIIGPVKIGCDVVIGANSVVVHDIPNNCVVVGAPAKIIKRDIKMSDYV